MEDQLIKAIVYGGKVRAYAARTTNLVKEACRRQDTWATASAALGRTLTITSMMGAMLKGDDTIMVKIEGDGPIGAIIADANAKGGIRGYVLKPHVDFPSNDKGKLDVRRAVGEVGTLSVVKDLGLKDYFTGQVPIVSGEISEDFTYYFATSEQIPSAVGAGVLVDTDYSIKASGGFIIQLMPGADDEMITDLEKRLQSFQGISAHIEQGKLPVEILYDLFDEKVVQLLDSSPIHFECGCSQDKILGGIKGLGAEEIQAMIHEDHGAEATCHFCNEVYQVSEEELQKLLDEYT